MGPRRADDSGDEFAPEVDIWAGPHVSGATYEELEERLQEVRGEKGEYGAFCCCLFAIFR
jgi:hypothetical protein